MLQSATKYDIKAQFPDATTLSNTITAHCPGKGKTITGLHPNSVYSLTSKLATKNYTKQAFPRPLSQSSNFYLMGQKDKTLNVIIANNYITFSVITQPHSKSL